MPPSNTFSPVLKSETLINRLIILILICYPSVMLTVRGGMGVLFFLLLIISLASLYQNRLPHSTSHWDRISIAFAVTMASPVVAIFLSQAYHGQFSASAYDWAARFLLAIPIFLALRQINARALELLQLSLPLGTLITLVTLYFHHTEWGIGRYTTGEYFNLIHFSDVALILGFLSLFGINPERNERWSVVLFKLCGFFAGVYMSIQSGERGGWIAIPPLFLLWVVSYSKERILLKLSIAALAICCAAVISYFLVDLIHSRINSILLDLNDFSHGNKDTSLGIRIQQWKAAILLFSENPLFGVGPGGFLHAMPGLGQQGLLSAEAARMGNAEIHSEIFAKGAETGMFGLFSLLSIYIVPTAIFRKVARLPETPSRRACLMGIALVAAFFIFGLTVEIFNLKMTAAFFSLTLAVLMATATTRTNH